MISNRAYHWHLKGKIVSIPSSKFALKRSPLVVSGVFNSLQPVKSTVFNKNVDLGLSFALPSIPATSSRHQVWYRVSQLAAKYPAFTENAIRAQIFASKPRLSAKTKTGNSWINGNGLAPAIRKCGRSVLINESMYAKWIETGSCGQGSQA